MRLRTALLAATALVAATEVARAEPISTAIGLTTAITSLGASAATAGAIGGAIIGTALSVGASLLFSAFKAKPKAGEAATGVEMSVQLGGDVPRQIPVGRCSLKGQLVYQNTSGAENALLEQVFILSDWPIGGLAEIWLGGLKRPIQLHSSGPGWQHWLLTEFAGLASVVVYDGTQTEADGSLVANANPSGRWTANSRLTGLAYAKLNLIYNKYSPLYEDGVPSFNFVVDGAKLYDRRRDDTAGGVGAQRWDDPSTWTTSANPAVIRENYLRGFWRAGELILGMGVPGYDLVGDSFVAAANAADEIVTKADGSTEPRYRCGTVLSADEGVTHQEILGVLDSTDAGELFEAAGLYLCQAGVAQGVVRTVTDDDLVLGEPVSYAGKRSRAELVNGVHGQFLDPTSGYQPQDYVARISLADEAVDGGPLRKALDQLSTTSQSQAERVAEIRRRQARAQATGSIAIGCQHRDLIPGDWIRWTSKRFDGASLTSKVFRIVDRRVDPATKVVRLSLEEISASVYAWSSGEEGEPVPVVVPPGPPLLPSTVAGFTLQAFQIIAGDGVTQMPGIKATWTPITDPTVDTVVVQLRPVGSTSILPFLDPSPEDGELTIAGGLAPGTAYEGRAILQTTPPRPVDWTPWRPVSTGEAKFDIDLGDVDDKVRLLIDQALAAGDNLQWAELLAGSVSDLGAQVRSQHGLVLERVAELTEKTSTRIDEAGRELAETRKQIHAGTERSAAQFDELTETIAGNEEASARHLEALQASVVAGDTKTSALVADEAQTRADQIGAQAQRSSALEATVNDNATGHLATRSAFLTFQSAQGTANATFGNRLSSLESVVTSATDGNAVLKARIAAEEATRADQIAAEAQRSSVLEATVNNQTTGLVATRAGFLEFASVQSTANSTFGNRLSVLEGVVTSTTDGNLALKARIAAEETIRNDQFGSLATRANTLEATVLSGTDSNTNIRASLTAFQQAQATLNDATSSSVSNLTTRLGTAEANINAVNQARVEGDQAVALLAQQAQATADGSTAGGRFLVQARAGSNGTDVVLAMQGSRTNADGKADAGLYVVLPQSGAPSIVLDAAQIRFGSLASNDYPFEFVGGQLRLRNNLIAPGAIASADSKVVPNGTLFASGIYGLGQAALPGYDLPIRFPQDMILDIEGQASIYGYGHNPPQVIVRCDGIWVALVRVSDGAIVKQVAIGTIYPFLGYGVVSGLQTTRFRINVPKDTDYVIRLYHSYYSNNSFGSFYFSEAAIYYTAVIRRTT